MSRQVDEAFVIGREIAVMPTDIDSKIVRVIARGRRLGGAEDGAPFQDVHELSRGQSFAIGANVIVTLLDISGKSATFGILAPPTMMVQPVE